MDADSRARIASGVPALRAGRTDHAFPAIHRITAHDDHQLARQEMGADIHHPCGVWRSILRVIPALLLHELRRRLLALDAHTLQLRTPGCELRIPPQTGQHIRHPHLRRFPVHKRMRRVHTARSGRRHDVFGAEFTVDMGNILATDRPSYRAGRLPTDSKPYFAGKTCCSE